METLNSQKNALAQSGFTLIELVVTLIMIGIMAATIAPRLFTSNGFEEYGYRTEIISTLRAVQLRAMQQTQSEQCHKIKISNDNKMLGLLAKDSSADYCDETTWYDLSTEDGLTSVQIDKDHSVTISGDDFSFDQLGRPVNCSVPCDVIIHGESNLTIRVEQEGYIHAL
ncbi:MAG: type II secretion system protein [Thalassotalea sp.]|nr:type II secretion system protein [Thalassotalea sp.]